MNPVARNEAKYQFIKLVKSGRTLIEAKALMKAASVALHPEYTSAKDLKDLAKLEGLNHLLLTRAQGIELYELKLKASRSYISGRDEAIAKWGTRYRGNLPLDWKRDGNLIRKGKPNKPRPGSSRKPYRKVGKTRVSGAAKTVKDFETLVKILQKLQTKHGRGNDNALRKAFKSIRTQVKSGTV
jgi:hypothetical protein